MEAKEFEFEFRHKGRKLRGTLQIMNPFKSRLYRVYVEKTGEGPAAVFIFHEVNEPERRFLHYYQNNYGEEMAKSILKELNNY